MKKLDPEKFYPLGDAARELGMKVSTVKQHIRSGRLIGRAIDDRQRGPLVLGQSILSLWASQQDKVKKKGHKAAPGRAKRSGIPVDCGALITVSAAAERLQASEYTVRKWLREGILQGVQQGVKNIWMACSNSVQKKRRSLNLP